VNLWQKRLEEKRSKKKEARKKKQEKRSKKKEKIRKNPCLQSISIIRVPIKSHLPHRKGN
jgi:hypothetical protein